MSLIEFERKGLLIIIIIIKIVYRFNVSRNENFVLVTLKGRILVIRVDDIDVECRSGWFWRVTLILGDIRLHFNKVHQSSLRDDSKTINGSLVRVYLQRNWRVFRNPVVSLGPEYLPKRLRTRNNPKKKRKKKWKISFIQRIKRTKNGTECGPGKTAYCTVENGPGWSASTALTPWRTLVPTTVTYFNITIFINNYKEEKICI